MARHHLGGTAEGVVDAVQGLVALHSSDPATPVLACRARTPRFASGDLDHALYEARTLWRMHAMRRTLFVVPSAHAPVFDGAAARAVAQRERRRVEGWLSAEMEADRVPGWLAGVEARLLEALADGTPRRTQELSALVPELATELTLGSGKWTTRAPLSSRLLFVLAMEGKVVRAHPAGSWRSSQYHWASCEGWFGEPPETVEPPEALEPAEARARLARLYLASHGPATADDVRWWTGWTTRQTARALADAGAVGVDLDGGREGFVLPGDVETVEGEPAAVAFLPALDSTPMGWKERDWYLGAHAARLFDRNGNAGPTVWVGGRVAGGWGQRPDGEVVFELLEDVGSDAERRIAEEAGALTEWLDGTVVKPRFRTPLERALSAEP